MIGSYLGISFTVNDSRILTFTSFKRSESARTTKHTPIGGKPRTEYLGRELKKVTFTIELNALNGVRPRSMEERIMQSIGNIGNLVIGGRKIGKFMLLSADATYEEMTAKGYLMRETVDLTVEEYV